MVARCAVLLDAVEHLGRAFVSPACDGSLLVSLDVSPELEFDLWVNADLEYGFVEVVRSDASGVHEDGAMLVADAARLIEAQCA